MDDSLLVSRANKFYLCSFSLDTIEFLFEVPKSLSCLNLLPGFNRLFRLDSARAVYLNVEKSIIFLYLGVVYRYSLVTCTLYHEYANFTGKPFNLNVDSFALFSSFQQDQVVFGDYPPSVGFNECSIHVRSSSGKWDVGYTFPSNTINHARNVQLSLDKSSYYVTTGDFLTASAIWKISSGFSLVNLLTQHGQCSRACWVFEFEDRLFYASDSQTETNYLYSCSSSSIQSRILFFLSLDHQLIFSLYLSLFSYSNSVEPKSCSKMTFASLFDTKLAPAVFTPYSNLYLYDFTKGSRLLHRALKDVLPPRLFQFGDILFPSGHSPVSDLIHFYEQSSVTGPVTHLFSLS